MPFCFISLGLTGRWGSRAFTLREWLSRCERRKMRTWTSSTLFSSYKVKQCQGVKSEVNAKCQAISVWLPDLFLLLKAGLWIFLPMFNCADFSNVRITGQNKARYKERSLSSHHQVLPVIAQEVSLWHMLWFLKCLLPWTGWEDAGQDSSPFSH